jgi:hypothetical protein
MSTPYGFTLIDDTGDELECEVPGKFEVCPRCEGHGTHLNPAIGEHAYTPEEFHESFDDDEAEEYFRRGGIYDVTCEECGGARVVMVPDLERCNTEQRSWLEQHERDEEERARWDAADRRTMRMESGDYGS